MDFDPDRAKKSDAPGCEQQIDSLPKSIEDEPGLQESDVFEKALDELGKPDGNHSNAIQMILSNIGNGSLCGKKKQALRSKLGPFVDLGELPRAKELAAPGREVDMYYLLERIEGKLGPQASNGFRGALDELNKPNGDHSNAIQILKLNIDNKSLREIYSCTRLEVRKIFRLHHPELFADLSEEEKRDLANKLAALGLDPKYWIAIIDQNIKFSNFLMALDQLTVPGDEHDVAIGVLCLEGTWLRTIFPDLSEDVKKIMLSHDLVRRLLADLNLNKPNSKRSRLSRRFP